MAFTLGSEQSLGLSGLSGVAGKWVDLRNLFLPEHSQPLKKKKSSFCIMVLQGNSSEGRVLVLMGRDLKALPARTFCNVMVPRLPEPKELTCCLRGLASWKTKQQK